MSKYDPLREFLAARADDVVTVTFEELDALVGGLPASARKYPVWWRNDDPSHQHCQSWGQAGFAAHPDLGAGRVTFRRTRGPGLASDHRPGAAAGVGGAGLAGGDSARGGMAGYAFISYVREDGPRVDRLQRELEAAGIPVWRDVARLWPGEDWRRMIRQAITDGALVFLACFSRASVGRSKSYQNEEVTLAIEQLRLRRPGDSWLIPVRLDDCDIPELDVGGGRTLASIQRADLFGDRVSEETARLIAAILRILGRDYTTTAAPSAPGRGAPDPHVERASKASVRSVTPGVTHGTAASAPGRLRSTTAGLAVAVAIVLAVGIILSVHYLANNRGRIPQPSGSDSASSSSGPAPASGSVDLTNNTAWNTLGKASPIIIDGHQVTGGILVPVRRHTVQLALTSSRVLRSIRMPVGLTQQSTPGLSTITVSAGGHPHDSSHVSLHPNSTGQLVLSHIGSRRIIFHLASTAACCQTAYLGDLEVTSAGGASSTLSMLSDLEYDRATVVESTDANPAATTTGVAGGTYPYSDAITFTLDSAGQSYMEQWFGLNDRPLNHFSTVVVVTGIGADPRKQVAVDIDANSDTVAGPIMLRPGQSKYVNVNLAGATVLRLTAESPRDSCCYVVAFGDPILKPSPG